MAEVVVEDDRTAGNGVRIRMGGEMEIGLSGLGKIPSHTQIINSRADNCGEMFWFEGYKCLKCSNVVKDEPGDHHSTQLWLREVLVKHEQVVAEVKVGLAWIIVGECSSSEVIDGTLRHTDELVSAAVESPA